MGKKATTNLSREVKVRVGELWTLAAQIDMDDGSRAKDRPSGRKGRRDRPRVRGSIESTSHLNRGSSRPSFELRNSRRNAADRGDGEIRRATCKASCCCCCFGR